MSRMKTFLKYLIVFIIFYLLVDAFSYLELKSTYLTKQFETNFDSPQIEIKESKATVTNGYINGKITNNLEEKISEKYLKLDYYSARNVNMGTKYIEIGDLEIGDTKDFTSRFNFDNVDHIECSLVDKANVPNSADFKLDDFSKDKINWVVIFCAAILIWG